MSDDQESMIEELRKGRVVDALELIDIGVCRLMEECGWDEEKVLGETKELIEQCSVRMDGGMK